MSEETFRQEVASSIDLYERANGHAATRIREMIERYGEIEALSRFMESRSVLKGFRILRDNRQLDKTFESLVVRFQYLFTSTAVESAQWRLNNADDLLEEGFF